MAGKDTAAADKVRAGAGAAPVPLSGRVCGLAAALLVNVRAPLRAPTAVGVKVTVTLQAAPTARVVHPLADCAKSPVAAIFEIFKAAVPELLTVTV
jgi:hypothetical protein